MQFADQDKVLRVMTVDPELEQQVIDSRVETAEGVVAALEPAAQRAWINAVTNGVRLARELGHSPILLVSEGARPLVKSSTQRDIPQLVVLSVPEIDSEISVESIGEIRAEADS